MADDVGCTSESERCAACVLSCGDDMDATCSMVPDLGDACAMSAGMDGIASHDN